MTSVRARRAATSILLAAGGMLLLPAAGHADTCMKDYNGNYVCGASGTGPTSGPGSYSGFNGVQDGTPGEIGPDGQPMTAATPPAYLSPGWTPPPVPSSAQPAPNPAGISNVPPPGSTLTNPGAAPTVAAPGSVTNPGSGTASGTTSKELPPAAVPGSAADAARDTGSTATPSTAPTSSASAAASGEATAAPTMTEMAQGTPRPTRTAAPAVAGPATADATRASESEPFSPVPLLAVLGGLGIAGAVIWLVPGIRSAVTGLLTRGSH